MQRQEIPMSIAEYEALPKPFGYKVEYWGGKAVFTPRDCPVDCLLVPTNKPTSALLCIAPDASLQTALTECFFASFNDTVEFCDWREDAIWAHAKKAIADYFAGQRGKPHPVSRVLLDNEGNVQACALVLENADGVLELDLLFVHPDQQHRGIARTVVNSIINQLSTEADVAQEQAQHGCEVE